MLTLVDPRSPNTSSPRASSQSSGDASLVADYLAFDRQRTVRRQYMKAFGGMAMIVLVGALVGRVPVHEAWLVGALLILPPLVLATLEVVQRHRLVRRLDRVRAGLQRVRKS